MPDAQRSDKPQMPELRKDVEGMIAARNIPPASADDLKRCLTLLESKVTQFFFFASSH